MTEENSHEKNHTSTAWLTWGIMLVGANLRLPITMIPPLLPTIKQTLGLPASMAGMLDNHSIAHVRAGLTVNRQNG